MSSQTDKNLRLVFSQWQGGNNPYYYFGSLMLDWISPKSNGLVEKINIVEPEILNQSLLNEDGVRGRSQIIHQLNDARGKINKHNPDT